MSSPRYSFALFAAPTDRGRIPNIIVVLACLGMVGLSIGYLLLKTTQFSVYPGFDFRYIWLAGDLWADGINPYAETYQPEGEARIADGHVPIKWVYPPTWWLIATPFGLVGLEQAFLLWSLVNIGLVLAISGVLSQAYLRAAPASTQWLSEWTGAYTGALIFSALCLFLGILEATGIHFAVGQTSFIITMGISLMLYGRVTSRRYVEALGLIIVLLKPQIGGPFAVLLFLLDQESRKTVLLAAIGSAILAIPALIQDPSVISGFLGNLLAYDDFTDANKPLSTTGIRLLIFELFSFDTGNMIATALALVVLVGLSCGPYRIARAPDASVHAVQVLALSTAVITAFAPLHVYDLVLIAVALPILLYANWKDWIIPGLGLLIVLREENLANITGFHSPDVEIFPGSRLATLGAIVFLVGVIRIVQKLNTPASEAR